MQITESKKDGILFVHVIYLRLGFIPAPSRKNKSLAHEALLINRLGTSLRQHQIKHSLLEYIHRFSGPCWAEFPV